MRSGGGASPAADGVPVVSDRGTPRLLPDGLSGPVGCGLDITPQQEATQALQQAHDLLEQRVQERTAALQQEILARQRLEQDAQRAAHFAMLGRLAAGLSHEIRNPLGAVFLHVDVLTEELQQPSPDSPTQVAEALTEIKTQLARLDDLVQDYLSLVRIGSMARTVQDLGAAVQAWGAEMQPALAARGGRLQTQGLASLGHVAFHPSTLRRVLVNLVQNAVDALPQGGTVTLAGQGTATHVQLVVQDTGSGIAAEQLEQIFEPLYTTKPGGHGPGTLHRAADCRRTRGPAHGAERRRAGDSVYHYIATPGGGPARAWTTRGGITGHAYGARRGTTGGKRGAPAPPGVRFLLPKERSFWVKISCLNARYCRAHPPRCL